MKSIRNIITLIIALVIFPIYVSAASPQLILNCYNQNGEKQIHPENNVTCKINASNIEFSPKSFYAKISIDKSYELEREFRVSSENISANSITEENEIYLIFNKEETSSFEIGTFTFKIPSDAKLGVSKISLREISFIDDKYETIPVQALISTIRIEKQREEPKEPIEEPEKTPEQEETQKPESSQEPEKNPNYTPIIDPPEEQETEKPPEIEKEPEIEQNNQNNNNNNVNNNSKPNSSEANPQTGISSLISIIGIMSVALVGTYYFYNKEENGSID